MQNGWKTCRVESMLENREGRYNQRKFEEDSW